MGNVGAVEGGREDFRLARVSEWGICYQRSPPPGILGLSSPGLPPPNPNTHHCHHLNPLSSPGQNIEFCLQSNISEELSLLCISLGRVDPAWGPFFPVRRAL